MPESTLFHQVLPPGEMVPLTCDKCKCTSFLLFGESHEGDIHIFHTKCTGCGKRGVLSTKIEVATTRTFQQFAEIPDSNPTWTPIQETLCRTPHAPPSQPKSPSKT